MKRKALSPERRLSILIRDDLTCLYCGVRPGKDGLNVAHIIPHSRGGSDHDNNLVTACVGCNAKHGQRVVVPSSHVIAGDIDAQGWQTWKRWGSWVIHYNPEPGEDKNAGWPLVDSSADIALTFQPKDYWIALDRVHDPDWEDHLRWKPWMRREHGSEFVDRDFKPENWSHFVDAIAFARTLVRSKRGVRR